MHASHAWLLHRLRPCAAWLHCESASVCAPQVNLPSGVANVSFVGLAGSSYTGDMAIDSVVLSRTGSSTCLSPAPLSMSPSGRSRDFV